MNQKTAIRLPSKVVRYSKTDSRYWGQPGRLFTQHGNTDYCCRFSHNGKRGFFDLNTADKAIAQKRAVDRYKYVVHHGWEAGALDIRRRLPAIMHGREATCLCGTRRPLLAEVLTPRFRSP